MKNTLAKLLGLLSVAALSVSATSSIHMLGGLNISDISGFDYTSRMDTTNPAPQEISQRMGWNTTLRFEKELTPSFSLITGIGLETRGKKETLTNTVGITTQKTEFEVNLLYLQVPILPQYNIRFGNFRISLFAGPELGYMLTATSNSVKQVTIPGDTVRVITTEGVHDFSRSLSMMDAGLTAGLGAEYLITENFGVCFRPAYYYGLTDFIDKVWARQNGTNHTGKHTNIKAAVGIRFRFPQ